MSQMFPGHNPQQYCHGSAHKAASTYDAVLITNDPPP